MTGVHSLPSSPAHILRRRLAIGALVALFLIGGGLLLWNRLRTHVPLGPQQTVQTTNPKVGVHTRLTDEVEEWKIKRTLEMVREMGAPWIVEYFPWAYGEPRQGQFDWAHSDMVIDHATRQGLTVVARLGYVPEWARPRETTPLYLEDDAFDDFGRFAAAFAERYQGRVSHIIIGNEPNLALEWGYQPPDAERYTELLRTVYPMVKAVAPEVEVLAGALAPTNAPEGSTDAINDLVFLQQMYDAGAADFFDTLAIHAYGWHAEPDAPPAPDAINFRRSELLREIMVANGDGEKSAMITEGGWNDHPRWTRAVRPSQRAAYTVRAYEMALEWPWLDAMALWAFRFPWDARNYQDNFAFVGTDFEPKPIYLEVQAYTSGEVAP
jgi:hypothetical protein